MELLLFILASLSFTNLIQNEVIFSWLRKLIKKLNYKVYEFVICPVCFGFWVGIGLSFFFNLHTNMYMNIILGGLISSIMNKILAKYIGGFTLE